MILFLDQTDALFGRRTEDEEPDRPLVLGVRSIRSIPPEFRKGMVVVRAPRPRWWQRSLGASSVSRTLAASSFALNGFSRKADPGSASRCA